MSLLDTNLKEIIGNEPKHNWKDYFQGITLSLELKDQNGTYMGKFLFDNPKINLHTLYSSDGTICLTLKSSGIVKKNVEIKDSENNLIGKTGSKLGLTKDQIWLENTNGEKILECKFGFNIPIWNKDKKTVAKYSMKRWRKGDKLHVILIDNSFDKLTILGFALALLTIHEIGSRSGSTGG